MLPIFTKCGTELSYFYVLFSLSLSAVSTALLSKRWAELQNTLLIPYFNIRSHFVVNLNSLYWTRSFHFFLKFYVFSIKISFAIRYHASNLTLFLMRLKIQYNAFHVQEIVTFIKSWYLSLGKSHQKSHLSVFLSLKYCCGRF